MKVSARWLGRRAARWTPALIVAMVAAGPAALTSPSPLVIHEWGTFVSMEGSDGLALEGLHHDEADLPEFVHSRGKDQLRLHATVSKLETPVIYFYPGGPESAGYANVRVDFPEGIVTQWFPQASLSSPRLLQGDAPPPLKGGSMTWYVQLSPDSSSSPSAAVKAASLPHTAPEFTWNFTRQTHSAFVTADIWDWAVSAEKRETEKFIFYRGLGRFTPPLRVESGAAGRLTMENTGTEPLQHLFLLRIENGRGIYQYFPALAPGQKITARIVPNDDSVALEPFVNRIGKALGARLVQQGLFTDEAQAMVNTWSRSYFRTEGIRVLYLVPRAQIDQTLPLTIQASSTHGNSVPTRLERVFVGRVECLTPEEEARIEGWLRDLASPDADRAKAARDGLIALGRFAEPHLRRALQNSTDPAVRARAQALLYGDALDELIAAERAFPNDRDVKARHAALLRRAGLTEEARAEGQAILALLQAHVPAQPKNPTLTDHVTLRKWLRSMAFAREAIGDPGPTATAYGDWVNFASELKNKDCQSCHTDAHVHPVRFVDLRDWWGGERFRTFAQEAGKVDALIAAAQQRLKTAPSDPQALLALAYLLPARGDTDAAEAAWQKLGAG